MRFILKAHKYIKKYQTKGGKWVYVYPREKKEKEPQEKVDDPKDFQAEVIEGIPANRPEGGFYISEKAAGEEEAKAVLVPQQYIHGTVEHMGHTWVIHNAIGADEVEDYLVATEIRSGLKGARSLGDATDLESSEEALKNILDQVGQSRVSRVVGKADAVASLEIGDDRIAKLPLVKRMSQEAKDKLVGRLALQYAEGRVDLMDKWTATHLKKDSDWQTIQEEMGNYTPRIVQKALERNMPLYLARDYVRNMDMLSNEFAKKPEEIEKWADDYAGIDLEDFTYDDWNWSDPRGNFVEGREVVEHAIDAGNDWDGEMEFWETYFEDVEKEERAYDRADYQDLEVETREHALQNNNFTHEEFLGGGCNTTSIVELSNDTYIEAVWKPSRGENGRLRDSIQGGTYYAREAMAYDIDKALDLGLVPPTYIREHGGDIGSVQEFKADAVLAFEIGETEFFSRVPRDQVIKAAVLDFLMHNSDRHDQNFMVDSDNNLVLIDNGLSLPLDENEFRSDIFAQVMGEDIPDDVHLKLETTDWSGVLNKYIEHGISDEEIDSFIRRLNWLDGEGRLPTMEQMYHKPWS